ncbi:hypothetical protein H2203_002899 [Taxawa tesnikishii (nom. ined.)]|nr:hypothetical protein H2203_002899 [Dothideales sp. JES 119]
MYPNPAGQPAYPQQNGYAAPPPPFQGYGQQYQAPAQGAQQWTAPPYQGAYQQTQQQPTSNGPPPAKRQKSAPVITRYPPPPGYVPPANAQLPSQVPVYQAAPYTAPQPYGHPGYAQTPNPAPGYPGYPPQQGWSYQQSPHPASYSASSAAPQPTPGLVATPSLTWSDSNTADPMYGVPSEEVRPKVVNKDDWEYDTECLDGPPTGCEFEGPQPELALPMITWHPANPTKRPLPSTFAEAELEALAESKPREHEDECISEYFTGDKRYSYELSIKQTDEWQFIKDDLIFVEFAAHCEVVPLEQIIANRDRPDPSASYSEQGRAYSRGRVYNSNTRANEAVQQSVEEDQVSQSDGDQAMDMSADESSRPPSRAVSRIGQAHVLDNLEAALSNSNYDARSRQSSVASNVSHYSRGGTRYQGRSRHQRPPKPVAPPKDVNQESVLAALGVEGSPKVVYATPGPAFGPPSGTAPPSRAGSVSAPSPYNNYSHDRMLYGPGVAPPPPPPMEPERSPSYDPWQTFGIGRRNHGGGSPRSETSQHTQAASDFRPEDRFHPTIPEEDNDATPRAKQPGLLHSNSSRKRAYEEGSESEPRRRQNVDDVTPKARKTARPRVQAAYSRRW